jgi:hypothetical protein
MRFGALRVQRSGQMSVELALCIPVVLAVIAIVVNTMVYLDVSARFDRLAADAVRIEAVSPGYEAYGTEARADKVRALLEKEFAAEADFVHIEVHASTGSDGSGSAPAGIVGFSLIPELETYECTLYYSPWGFKGSFFGVRFLETSRTRSYTIDPFRPGVLL